MAGRGRGRGGNMSFTMEQLGLMPGEAMPGPVLQPPPTYPKMDHPPVPLTIDPQLDYLLTLKRDFVDFVRDSPAFVRPAKAVGADIQRYSDRYQVAQPKLALKWAHFPAEVRPHTAKRKAKTSVKAAGPSKVAKTAEDLSSRLEELEKGERNSEEEEGEAKEEGEGEEEVEGEEVDEEMDDGTDYVNNYFDNGDGYLDEDDDMDDGPVY